MQQVDISNKEFEYTWRLIEQTNRCIYLTGKAGTGKTTLLKYVANNSKKNMVVLAPTGVAAINAGGQTMHSFFKLPFGPLLPNDNRFSLTQTSNEGLFSTLKYRSDKVETINKLDLLIIDEISMVRADVLDLIDKILRGYRKSFLPFGGVQVVLIGDPFQLPPVFKEDETKALEEYYDQLYFFGSDVFTACKPFFIELKKVYRQQDMRFVEMLNRMRVVDLQNNDLRLINSRVSPKDELRNAENTIILTTTNNRVDRYNEKRLKQLEGESFTFEAEITNNFPEKNAPADMLLTLKKGAQVMFVKNDPTPARKFYNGMLAKIVDVDEDTIVVENNIGEQIKVVLDIWENIAYKWNRKEQIMDEEVLGTFKQYPLRLAWAITVHKSQGLTFDHIIADVSSSFSPGQIYVALSRCTSLEGIMLTNSLNRKSFHKNTSVQSFALNESAFEEIEAALDESEYEISVEDAFKVLEEGNVAVFWDYMDKIDPNGRQWQAESFRLFMNAYLTDLWQEKEKADNLEHKLKKINDKSTAFETAKRNLKKALEEKQVLINRIKELEWTPVEKEVPEE